ncbi:Diphthamide synthase subunit DPH2 [Encephalitozoon hellem ATCC 50504]|uniref:Diphthamide synthase subunit DPH2 n=1 Tax=Encephalitozoon hellem TaxID=27973 RepID=A0A9Q9C3F7_ENCHE|nr:Diphthamide synthase subunit DPH2 [Encephalitozoon hellem ATCC 50504]AFM98500.1 Diphthamide synthase subunit DPH2 [Encephalitozoon hellem ATCC 50504]UTX43426.1 putative diphthamide synthase subunit DPH2 [Encephalitozoon hellem]WEL38890.1 diphthamide synthase subunit DPH2 [Encephalitozoon hellem]|eukprot:XP_003887481.1 Diphthamide synthase subunit DPH2 [Encephalitozoon hellem ATCC 50504]
MDFGLLDEKLRGKTEVGLLSTEEYKHMLRDVYDHIKGRHPHVDTFLLNGEGILCPLKTKSFEFFVLLGVCCPLHPFEDFISISCCMSQEDMNRLEGKQENIVCDSVYGGYSSKSEDEIDSNTFVVTKSQMFYDYYFYKYDAKSFYELEKRDRMQYLSSKCNKGRMIQDLQIFAIIFTSRVYEELARTIRKALISRRKNAYLLFLKDLSYERMITIEGTECIVIVDCPLFECNLELHIPIVTPFEVEYAFSGEWKRFDKNSFSIEPEPKSDCTEIDLVGRAGRILLKSEGQNVPYCYGEEDMSIHNGESGIPCRYDSEGI